MRPLNEVSDEIKSRILAEESPSYVASLAEELFTKLKGGTQFTEVVGNKAAVVSVSDFAASDPEGLAGLKTKVIADSRNNVQLHHFALASVLVRIDEFKEPEIPGLLAIKEKV